MENRRMSLKRYVIIGVEFITSKTDNQLLKVYFNKVLKGNQPDVMV
jgi:hypothetical protein